MERFEAGDIVIYEYAGEGTGSPKRNGSCGIVTYYRPEHNTVGVDWLFKAAIVERVLGRNLQRIGHVDAAGGSDGSAV